MRLPIVLTASLSLLPPVLSTAAQTQAADSFVLELTLPAQPQPDTIAARCQTGCLWVEKTIECSAGQPCRALIASSNIVASMEDLQTRSVEERPLADTVCLGLQTKSHPRPLESSERCQDTIDERGNPGSMWKQRKYRAPTPR